MQAGPFVVSRLLVSCFNIDVQQSIIVPDPVLILYEHFSDRAKQRNYTHVPPSNAMLVTTPRSW